MNKHVIVVNGTGGVGKDTLIDNFRAFANNSSIDIATIFPVKRAAKILGWDDTKSDENRLALCELKKLSDKFWDTSMNYVDYHFKDFLSNGTIGWMFIQCREPENIKKLVDKYHAKTVLITREGIGKHGNSSDDNVENYDYDLIFANNGDNIRNNSREFAVKIFELCGEDPDHIFEMSHGIETNITGKKFFDAGEYGLGKFTVHKCYTYYVYNKSAVNFDGSHWFKHNEIAIILEYGLYRTIPFCPWHKIYEIGTIKSFKEYYDEQPW